MSSLTFELIYEAEKDYSHSASGFWHTQAYIIALAAFRSYLQGILYNYGSYRHFISNKQTSRTYQITWKTKKLIANMYVSFTSHKRMVSTKVPSSRTSYFAEQKAFNIVCKSLVWSRYTHATEETL